MTISAIIALSLACVNVFLMKHLYDENSVLRKLNSENAVLLNDMKNLMLTLNEKRTYAEDMAAAWKEQVEKFEKQHDPV